MAYQVKLKRITDKETLDKVVAELVGSSGAPAEKVAESLSAQAWTSIGKNFDRTRAKELRTTYEALGARIQTIDLDDIDDDDDEAGEEEGRILSQDEFVKALNERGDIFSVEEDTKTNKIIFLLLIVIGVLFTWGALIFDIGKIAPDFLGKPQELKEATVSMIEIDRLDENKEEEKKEEKPKPQQTDRVQQQRKGSGGVSGGGGDPKARATQQGVLGVLSGAITGASVSGALGAAGGYAAGLDAIMSGGGGLAAGGGGGIGRAGGGGIGFGDGQGSGFGGGTSGVDKFAGLMGGGGSNMKFEKKADLKVKDPGGASAAGLTGGRSRAEIMRVVRQNMASLQYAYNQRLKDNPGMQGRVTVKWAIDEFGNVIFCKLVGTTINDDTFEQTVINRIKTWAFGKINIPGDVTEVEYPFVFTPN
jgi:hypothetical protein